MQTYSMADWKPQEAHSQSEITLQEIYEVVLLVLTPVEIALVRGRIWTLIQTQQRSA